jgi:large subunit ribosomal protein L3
MKNKRLPGHMGATAVVSKHLEVVKVDPRAGLILVKGSVVGHPGALVYLQKVQGDL